ncbi:MAG: hypothetical protein ACI9GM_000617 [Salibacteraceae bacterium]|jgi:hypothetical protein
MKKIILFISILSLAIPGWLSAQYTTKMVKSKHEIYTDSLKSMEYDRVLPIWGAGAYKQGFDIPFPLGVMVNTIWMRQGITIDNMRLGLTTDSINVPLTQTDFVQFGENVNESFSTTFRPDIWILPFVNVYGLFGAGRSRTKINLVAPIAMYSVVEQGITTTGFGILGAGGVGPLWVSVDANFTWNKPELLDKATQVNVLGIRMGHSFMFKKRPDRNINIWAGTMRVKMNSETVGAIVLKEAIPIDEMNEKGEDALEYYESLSPVEKVKPANLLIKQIGQRLVAADGEAVIKYGMDKQTKQLWNASIGGQFQFNKAWQFRTELGFIGDRKSFMLSLNYRFLGPRKS